MIWRRRLAVAVSGLLAALLALFTIGIVVPAWTPLLLVPGVIAPEWAPYTLVAALWEAFLCARLLRGTGRWRTVLLTVFTLSGCASAAVVFTYPGLVAQADAQLAALPGDAGWSYGPYDLFGTTGRTRVTETPDVPVPLRDGGALALDLYRPATPGPHPAVVVIYGGAWAFGDRQQCRPLALDLARAGYAVVMVDYRHVPKFRYPTQTSDVSDALHVLATHAAEWQIDVNRIALLGRSAGAEIALVLASTPQPVRFAAAVGIYAPIDLVAGYEKPPSPDPANVRGILEGYLGGPPGPATLARYRDASPQTHVAGLREPVLLMVGTHDELVLPEFQRPYVAALVAQHTPVVALEVPFANHAFDSVPLGRGFTFERAVLLRFLHSTLAARSAPPRDP